MITKEKYSFKNVLTAVKKLSAEERQLLRLKLFSNDVLDEMKTVENNLKKQRREVKKSDDEIVTLTNSIRNKKYANAKKMLH